MAITTQMSPATNLTLGAALGGSGYYGIYIVARHSDGNIYPAADTASTQVIGYTLEGGAIGDVVTVFPGIDQTGKPVCIGCKNSTLHPLANTNIGNVCYIEGSATDASDGHGAEWTVCASGSSNSIIAGIFRGFTQANLSASATTRCAVEVGRQNG